MRTLISLGVAFFVIVLNHLTGWELTPNLNLDAAAGIINITFIGTTVATWLVLKYRRGGIPIIRRLLISLGVGVAILAFLYGICFAPFHRGVAKDAVIAMGVSASLVSIVTFVLLTLPKPLSARWQKALISLGVAFFAAVIIGTAIVSHVEEISYAKGMSVFAGLFVGTAIATSLVLGRFRRTRA